MNAVTLEELRAYLDDALTDEELARVERNLRESPSLRQILHRLMAERDRGEHSVGAVWRRQRLTCPTRDQIGSMLLGALEPELADYIEFHINLVGCPFCTANWNDLQRRNKEPKKQAEQRRHKLFASSAGIVRSRREKK
jgi:hypothetical protein